MPKISNKEHTLMDRLGISLVVLHSLQLSSRIDQAVFGELAMSWLQTVTCQHPVLPPHFDLLPLHFQLDQIYPIFATSVSVPETHCAWPN